MNIDLLWSNTQLSNTSHGGGEAYEIHANEIRKHGRRQYRHWALVTKALWSSKLSWPGHSQLWPEGYLHLSIEKNWQKTEKHWLSHKRQSERLTHGGCRKNRGSYLTLITPLSGQSRLIEKEYFGWSFLPSLHKNTGQTKVRVRGVSVTSVRMTIKFKQTSVRLVVGCSNERRDWKWSWVFAENQLAKHIGDTIRLQKTLSIDDYPVLPQRPSTKREVIL